MNGGLDSEALRIPVLEDVLEARKRIAPWIHRTPVMTSRYFDELTGSHLYFKCENFQKAGAFKARGACNAVFGLPESGMTNGVATHSSGNHGQALSFAATRSGIPATVVMPSNAPQAKKAAVLGYGGKVVECAPSNWAREEALQEVLSGTGAEFIHPYNDARVISGQATCAMELAEEVENLEAIVSPIGGGGLISGTCLAMSSLHPAVEIFAAEPANADDAFRSLRAGEIIEDDVPDTIADGLKANLGSLTWHFVSTRVSEVLTVSENEIVDAMFLAWQRMKIIIEPSAAVSIAAVLRNPGRFAGKRVGVILTGGNVDLEKLPWQERQDRT